MHRRGARDGNGAGRPSRRVLNHRRSWPRAAPGARAPLRSGLRFGRGPHAFAQPPHGHGCRQPSPPPRRWGNRHGALQRPRQLPRRETAAGAAARGPGQVGQDFGIGFQGEVDHGMGAGGAVAASGGGQHGIPVLGAGLRNVEGSNGAHRRVVNGSALPMPAGPRMHTVHSQKAVS